MTRQEFMLAALAAGNGEAHTPVQVQKLFFLLDRHVLERFNWPRFHFQPHDYGPFDKAVYEDLRALAECGLVVIQSTRNGPEMYWLTSKGMSTGESLLETIPPSIHEYMGQLSAWVRGQSFASLVSGIHQQAPEMKIRSVFQEPR